MPFPLRYLRGAFAYDEEEFIEFFGGQLFHELSNPSGVHSRGLLEPAPIIS
jgi:hypothetical protein